MSQPIITTDISQIRPVFAQGAGENIKRYTQLKSMFQQGREYNVLAEPMPDGVNKITWHTEFEGTPQSFSKLTDDEQIAAKGRIKHQVNKLYKAVFKQLYKGSMSDVADMFKILDSCIEIPDYDNIYRIQRPDGNSSFVIIKWGFTTDDFNAPTGLIKKLVPTKVDTVKIKVIKSSKPAANEQVSVVYNGQTAPLTTDGKGYIYMEDIPLGDKFSVFADGKDNIKDYVCDGSDEYHYLIGTRTSDMNFLVHDAKGVPVADTEISFTYDGITYFETTDSQGRIILRDIPEGTEVVCRQRNISNHFVCNPATSVYEFVGVRPVAEVDVAVMGDNGDPKPGIDVLFQYADKQITLSTDRNGRVSIDNMPPDTEVNITCSGSGYQDASAKLFTHEGLNMAEIKLRKVSQNGCMTIRVVDNTGKPIVNTLVRCETEDFKSEYYTNENGEIALDKVNFNSNVVCTQIINGLGSHRHAFIFSNASEVYILKGMKIISDITDLEIHVVTKQKEDVPNLRVTIDDGHNVLNRITDRNGMIHVEGLAQGKTYTLTTEYSGKTTEVKYVPHQAKESLTVTVGRNNIGFLLWLIPLILLLGWLCVAYLVPWIVQVMDKPLLKTEKKITIHMVDSEKSTAIGGAIVTIMNNGVALCDTADASGACHFTIVDPSSDTVAVKVSAPEYQSFAADAYLYRADTTYSMVLEPKGLNLDIRDEKTGNALSGAKVHVEYEKTKLDVETNADGKVSLRDVPMDDKMQVKVVVNAEGHKEYVAKFLYVLNKTLLIPEKSLDVRDIPIDCGCTIKSDGFHSTIQTVNMKEPKGKFVIGYDTFTIPDEIIIYKGPASEISDDKIIFRTNGFVKGPYKYAVINYEAPDGIITVRVNGGDDSQTQWYVVVKCPTK
ncbi:MAG: hypothetical protein MJZ66_01975 [Bacteroidales bacterium]|nr:hypothetical protein [Bacteroidales bacterium]